MLEDLSQGGGSNHEKKKMEAKAQIPGEDSKLDEIVVSQAKKQCVLERRTVLGRTLLLVLRSAVPFYNSDCPLGPSWCKLTLLGRALAPPL